MLQSMPCAAASRNRLAGEEGSIRLHDPVFPCCAVVLGHFCHFDQIQSLEAFVVDPAVRTSAAVERRLHVTPVAEGALAAAGGRVLDMVQAAVHSMVVAVAAIWASGAKVAEGEGVAPVAAIAASEAVVFGTSQPTCAIHFESARA